MRSHDLLTLNCHLSGAFGALIRHTDEFSSFGFIMASVTRICKAETPVRAGGEPGEVGSGG